jgi:hypothetical protein
MSVIWGIVDWLSLPMVLILAAVLVWRRIVGRFPFFFSYLVVSILTGAIRLLVYWREGTGYVYFYTFWISDLPLTVLGFLASYELLATRLFPQFYRIRFYRYLFPVVAIVAAILTILTTVASAKIGTVFIKIDHGFQFLRVATLSFFISLMLIMGRQWGQYEFGIAAGLAVDAAGFLTTFALWTRIGKVPAFVNELPTIANEVACIIWLITFLRSEKPTPVRTVPVSSEVLEQAKKWEGALKESVTGKKRPQ